MVSTMTIDDLKRLWLATMFLYMASGFTFPIFPLYMAYRGLSPFEVGMAASVATLVSIMPVAVIGRVSDVVNREKLQGALGVTLAALILAYIHANSFSHFLVLHPAYVTIVYAYMTLSGAIAMDYIVTRRGTSFGRFRTSGAIGWIFGTLLGGWTVDNLGFTYVFMLSSAFFIISASLFGLGGLKGKTKRKDREKSIAYHMKAFRKVLFNKAAYTLYASVFIAWLTTPAYYTFLPLYMTKELDTSRFLSSIAFTVTPFAEVPAMIYFGSLSDKIGRKKVIALCLAAYPIRYILTVTAGAAGEPWLVVAAQLLHGLTFGGLYVVSVAYLSEAVNPDLKGLALSLYTIFSNIGSFIGNYTLGYIVDSYGFTLMYYTAALISSLSIPTLAILSKKH